jgi:hypothetical protein
MGDTPEIRSGMERHCRYIGYHVVRIQLYPAYLSMPHLSNDLVLEFPGLNHLVKFSDIAAFIFVIALVFKAISAPLRVLLGHGIVRVGRDERVDYFLSMGTPYVDQ